MCPSGKTPGRSLSSRHAGCNPDLLHVSLEFDLKLVSGFSLPLLTGCDSVIRELWVWN